MKAVNLNSNLVNSTLSSARSSLNGSLAAGVFQSTQNLRSLVHSAERSLSDQIDGLLRLIVERVQRGNRVDPGTLDYVRKAYSILQAIRSLSLQDTGSQERNLLNAQKNAATANIVKRVRNNLAGFLSKALGIQDDMSEVIQARNDKEASLIAVLAASLADELNRRRSNLTSLANGADTIIANVSESVGNSRFNFEKFNQRINTSETDLYSLSERAYKLMLETQTKTADMISRINTVLADRVEAAANRTAEVSADTQRRIESSVDEVKNSPNTVTQFVTNGSDRLLAFRDVLQQQAEKLHQMTVEMLTSAGVTINDIKAAASSAILRGDLSLSESEESVFNVLLGISDSLGSGSNTSDNLWTRATAELDEHRAEVAQQLSKLNERFIANKGKLELMAAKKDLIVNKKLAKFLDSLGADLSSEDVNLNSASQKFKAALNGESWTDNSKQVYSVSGMLRNLSLKNQGRLQGLLERVVSGHMTFSDALREARKIDLGSIQSSSDAAGYLVGSMIDYQQSLYRAFGDANQRLNATVANISTYIDSRGPGLLFNLDDVSNSSARLDAQVTAFSNQTATVLAENLDEIALLQDQIEQNQTAINLLIGDLRNRIDQLEGEMKTNQLNYETWIDSVIAEELSKAEQKGQALKRKLDVTDSPTSSLAQIDRPDEIAELTMELKEVVRRFGSRMRGAVKG
jgi:hypothetical protein